MVVTLQVSMAGVVRSGNPALALKWSPLDADAKANVAAQVWAQDESPAASASARRFALEAIDRDPTSVAAVRTLGELAEARDVPRALRLMIEAERLSRRDQATQQWLARHYGRTGDIDRMLRHFQIALGTSYRGWDTLLPLLASATEDPRLVAPLRALLATEPAWGDRFMSHLVLQGRRLPVVVQFAADFLDPAVPDERALIQRLIDRLVTAGQFQLAWATAARHDRTAGQRALVRDAGFDAPGGFSPFNWSLVEEAELAALLESRPGSRGSLLRLVARNGRTGEVATQLLRLPPGQYRMRAEIGSLPDDQFSWPQVTVRCASGGSSPPLTAIRPTAAGEPAILSGAFVVPAGCAWQWLSIRASASAAQPADDPWIDNVVVARSGGA